MEQFSCSLQDKYPEIAAQWDHERNAPLKPDQVGFGSTKKVYWICPRGHSYQSRIDHRTVMRSGCPYCSNKKPIVGENDLLTLYPEIASEWMRIPHFYSAFYVYVYATGLCAAISLSRRILEEGESAVSDYRKFLSAGCSVPPIEALKLAGIDMSRPEPVRQALEVFRETVKKMHEVTGK